MYLIIHLRLLLLLLLLTCGLCFQIVYPFMSTPCRKAGSIRSSIAISFIYPTKSFHNGIQYKHGTSSRTTTKHTMTRFISIKEINDNNAITKTFSDNNPPSFSTNFQFTPIFDFTQTTTTTTTTTSKDDMLIDIKNQSIASFERIDDAIMGGISLSKLMDVQGQDYVRWNGVCRTDGGGFCGIRTRPMIQPLNATNQQGIFITCRLASDNEPERRVWKVSLRTDESRGEMMLYQAAFTLPPLLSSSSSSSSSLLSLPDTTNNTHGTIISSSTNTTTTLPSSYWTTIQIPFSSFQMVRGPVTVMNGPALNLTRGIYQLGFIMSKFKIGPTTQEMENFHSGYFDLHIQKIGFYNNNNKQQLPLTIIKQTITEEPGILESSEIDSSSIVSFPSFITTHFNNTTIISKSNTLSSSSLLFNFFSPIFQFVFSEEANRRRSAMKILTQKRGMNFFQAIQFGIQIRKKSFGLVPSMIQTYKTISLDLVRTIMVFIVKCTIFYPLRVINMFVKQLSNKK